MNFIKTSLVTLILLAAIVLLPFVLLFQFIRDSLEPIIGLDLARGAAYGVFAALGFIVIARVIQVVRDREDMVAWVIQLARNGDNGPFTQWWDDVASRRYDNADQIRMDTAVSAYIKSYGSPAVIQRLIAEGYENAMIQDAAMVLGSGRMMAFLPALHDKLDSGSHPVSGLMGFLVGANIGYNATRR